jgi:hypothetical protein
MDEMKNCPLIKLSEHDKNYCFYYEIDDHCCDIYHDLVIDMAIWIDDLNDDLNGNLNDYLN